MKTRAVLLCISLLSALLAPDILAQRDGIGAELVTFYAGPTLTQVKTVQMVKGIRVSAAMIMGLKMTPENSVIIVLERNKRYY